MFLFFLFLLGGISKSIPLSKEVPFLIVYVCFHHRTCNAMNPFQASLCKELSVQSEP